MGGKKPLRRPLWPPTRATASNYYPLGLDGAGGAAKPLLRAPKKPAPLHGRLPAFSGAVDAFERARKCFLEWRYFFSIILSEFLKNRVALHGRCRDAGGFSGKPYYVSGIYAPRSRWREAFSFPFFWDQLCIPGNSSGCHVRCDGISRFQQNALLEKPYQLQQYKVYT